MKIVVVTQHIFPIQTPRSIRSTELIRELARRNYNITVYCVLGDFNYSPFLKQYPNITLKNIPVLWQIKPYTSDGQYKGHIIDRIANRLLHRMIEYPYMEFYFRIPELLKSEDKFDALISIGNPHHIHWGCHKFKINSGFNGIWIADCGDPFMENGQSRYHRKYFSKHEKAFCKACDFITVPHSQAIDGYYPEFRHKIKIIPQGFDFETNKKNSNKVVNPIPIFGYAGVFLKDIRNPEKLLTYLAELEKDFRFVVYTPYTELIEPFRRKMGERLVVKKPIERNVLLHELSKMDFVLNLDNVGMPTALPSKLIDYAISGRPILSLKPQNPDYKMIDDFLKGNYKQQYHVENLMQYHIKNVADQFVDLITKR